MLDTTYFEMAFCSNRSSICSLSSHCVTVWVQQKHSHHRMQNLIQKKKVRVGLTFWMSSSSASRSRCTVRNFPSSEIRAVSHSCLASASSALASCSDSVNCWILPRSSDIFSFSHWKKSSVCDRCDLITVTETIYWVKLWFHTCGAEMKWLRCESGTAPWSGKNIPPRCYMPLLHRENQAYVFSTFPSSAITNAASTPLSCYRYGFVA